MERSTRQRTAIREVLARSDRPLLADEVLAYAQTNVPGLGIATVYRNLKTLINEEALQVVNLPGDKPRFEFVHHHHHHFSCEHCKRVFDIHACPGDISRLVPDGFTVFKHELNLYGLCAQCALNSGEIKNA